MKKIILLFFTALVSLSAMAQPTPNVGAKLPDNVRLDADCFTDPPAIPFTFNLLAQSPAANVNHHTMPILGDIDNDGYIEIIVPTTFITNKGVSVNQLRIFKLKNNELIVQQTLTTPYFNAVACPYSIAKADDNEYAAIFLCTDDTYNPAAADKRKLIKYVYNPTSKLYEEFKVNGALKRGTYSDYSRKEMAQPMIADFNGDGIPEIATYDRVFNARTMELLADGGYLGQSLVSDGTAMGFGFGGHINNNQRELESASIMAIADMDNDNVPEVIGGNCVYKVKITNPNGKTGNSFTLWKKCSKIGPNGEAHPEAVDGTTAIADIDGDGYLDVIVTNGRNRNPTGKGGLYVWNPMTEKVLHSTIINNLPNHPSNSMGVSMAFVGDIDNTDGKNQPEICLTGQYKTYAYNYNIAAKTLTNKWTIGTNDNSGATTLTLFDFDQDGNYELIYRDESHLRILNGKDGSNKISPITCASNTGIEYPLVADVNGDGAAEIIVTGDSRLKIYASNPIGAWAPARKVWNQFAYNVVNINEDLTVPKVQFRQTTKFAGKDGVLGNANDIRPFNAYLQQQTSLNKNGSQLWLAANAKFFKQPKYEYDKATDKLKILLEIKNEGKNPFRNPFYVTIYKNNVGNASKYTYSHNKSGGSNCIEENEIIKFSFTLDNFKTNWNPNNGIFINLNDNGDGNPYQNVCDAVMPILYYPITPTDQDDCADLIDKTLTCPYATAGSTFQWQTSDDNAVTWIDVPGATNREYTTKQFGGTLLYRVNVTLPGNIETISNEVTIRMRSCQMPVNHNISVMGY